MAHQQAQSSFFKLAAEIRQQIYGDLYPDGVHFLLVDGVPRLTRCEGADDDSDRRPGGNAGYFDPLWARRVESSWGCHWRCEEAYLNMKEGQVTGSHQDAPAIPELLACKRLFFEITDFISDYSRIHLTDLASTDYLLKKAVSEPSEPSSSRVIIPTLPFEHLRHLDITLRIPGLFFYTLMKTGGEPPPHPPIIDRRSPNVWRRPEYGHHLEQFEQWTRIWDAMPHLRLLKSLSLSLDHGEPFSWTFYREDRILSRLLEVMPALEESKVRVTVCLPLLPPKKHREDTAGIFGRVSRFGEEGNSPPFHLNRRRRLAWFSPLNLGILWVADGVSGPAPHGTPVSQQRGPSSDWRVQVLDALNWDPDAYA